MQIKQNEQEGGVLFLMKMFPLTYYPCNYYKRNGCFASRSVIQMKPS